MCNGCTKRGYCRLEKHFYDAKKAHLAYCDTLVQSRNGFDLTLYDITGINSIVTPRIKKDSHFTIQPRTMKVNLISVNLP